MRDEPESPPPAALVREKRARILRRIGMLLSGLMVLTMLTILGLIVRTERAHDEARCAFSRHAQRNHGEVVVLEDARSCLPELEERRYLVQRAGAAPFELARKRLPGALFADERYRWTLRDDAGHKLVLRIEIDGQLSSEFFEQDVQR